MASSFWLGDGRKRSRLRPSLSGGCLRPCRRCALFLQAVESQAAGGFSINAAAAGFSTFAGVRDRGDARPRQACEVVSGTPDHAVVNCQASQTNEVLVLTVMTWRH